MVAVPCEQGQHRSFGMSIMLQSFLTNTHVTGGGNAFVGTDASSDEVKVEDEMIVVSIQVGPVISMVVHPSMESTVFVGKQV